MRAAAFLLLAALNALAQEHSLHCTVEPIPPALLYTAPEVAAGFTYSLPPGRSYAVVGTFLPDAGPESVFRGQIDKPPADRDALTGSWTYWLGLGTYTVRLTLSDETGGVCRKEWMVNVRKWPESGQAWAGIFLPVNPTPEFDIRTQKFLSHSSARLGTPDGTVRMPSRKDPPGQTPAQRITILLDAPSDPRRQVGVLDAFEVLLARLPAQSVRLVVFSLQEQCEILRRDNFRVSSMGEVRSALSASTGFRAVNVAELQAHPITSPPELLDSLVQQEAREAQPSSAVVFLGMGNGQTPYNSPSRPAPPVPLTGLPDSLPPLSYIQLINPPDPPVSVMMTRGGIALPGRRYPGLPNLIPAVIKRLNGKNLLVDNDKELERALEEVRKTLGNR